MSVSGCANHAGKLSLVVLTNTGRSVRIILSDASYARQCVYVWFWMKI